MLPFVALMSAAAVVMIGERLRAWMTTGARSVSPRAGYAVVALLMAGVLAQPMWSGAVSVSRRVTAPTVHARRGAHPRAGEAWGRRAAREGLAGSLDERRDDQARRGSAKDLSTAGSISSRARAGSWSRDPVRPSAAEAAWRSTSGFTPIRASAAASGTTTRSTLYRNDDGQLPTPNFRFPNCNPNRPVPSTRCRWESELEVGN